MPTPANPLFAVALLKIALDLKKTDASLEAIVASVTERMQLEAGPFRAFVDENLGLLKIAAPLKPQAVRAPARSRRTRQG